MLTLAVDAGYLSANPAEAARTPRQPEPQMLFLDADQVDRLANTIQEPYSTLVYSSPTEASGGEKPPPHDADDATSSGPESVLPSR